MFTHAVSKAILASAAAGFATFMLTPAAHAEIGAPRTMLVHYDDLNLASASGKARLQNRISYAASVVCGPADELSQSSLKDVGACEARAISNAARAMVTVVASREGTIRVAAN